MRFLLLTYEEIICGEESTGELLSRIQRLPGKYHSVTINEELDFQKLPFPEWRQHEAVILIELGLALPEVKCFAVNWWIEHGE